MPVQMMAIGETRPVHATAVAAIGPRVNLILAHEFHSEIFPLSTEDAGRLVALLSAAIQMAQGRSIS